MPITDPIQRQAAIEAGLNPDEYSVVSEGQQPTAFQSSRLLSAKPPETSAFKSGAIGFGKSLLPAGGGLGGAALGGLAAAALAPASGGLSIALPLIGGIAGALGTGYAQEKALDVVAPEFQQTAGQAIAEHPYAYGAGSLASLPFGGGVRTAAETLKVPRALARVTGLSTVAPNALDKSLAANAAFGAAIPTAISGAQALAGQEVSPELLLMDILGGAGFVKPTMLGKKVFPALPKDTPNFGAGIRQANIADAQAGKQQVEAKPQQGFPVEDTIKMEDAFQARLERNRIREKEKQRIEIERLDKQIARLAHKQDITARENLIKQMEEDLIPGKLEERLAKEEASFKKDQTLLGSPEQEILTKPSVIPQGSPQTFTYKPDIAPGQRIITKQPVDTAAEVVPAKGLPEPIVETVPPTPGKVEPSGLDLQPQPPTVKIGARFQEDLNAPSARVETEEPPARLASPISRQTTEFDTVMGKLGQHRNVDVVEDPTIVNPATKKPVKGDAGDPAARMEAVQTLRKGLAKINPRYATKDTRPHELFHWFWDHLTTSKFGRDQKLTSRGVKIVQEDARYQAWKAERETKGFDSSPEEFLTGEVGKAVAHNDKTPLNNWLDEFWSTVKYRFGQAKPEDITTLMRAKLLKDPSFFETRSADSLKAAGVKGQFQETEVDPETGVIHNRVPDDIEQRKLNKQDADSWRPPQVQHFKEAVSTARTGFQKGTHTPSEKSYVLSWDKDQARWYVAKPKRFDAGEEPFVPAGTITELSENQILVKANDGQEAHTISQHLPAPPKDSSPESLQEFSMGELKGAQGIMKEYNLPRYQEADDTTPQQRLKAGFDEALKDVPEKQPKNPPPPEHWQDKANRINDDRNRRRGGTQFQEVDDILPPDFKPSTLHKYSSKVYDQFRPAIDLVRNIGTKAAHIVADKGLVPWFEKYRDLGGRFVNEPLKDLREMAGVRLSDALRTGNFKEYWQGNTKELNNVRQWLHDQMDEGKSKIILTPNEVKIRDYVREHVTKQIRDEQAARPTMRKVEAGKYWDDYLAQMIDSKIMNLLAEGGDVGKQLREDFYAFHRKKQPGIEDAEIDRRYNLIRDSFQKKSVDIAEQFGPLDKAAGIGIPPSWREKNLLEIINRYGHRAARRFAYEDAFKANPEVMAALKDNPDSIGQHSAVQAVTRYITGIGNQDERVTNIALGLVKAGMFGTYTGLRDLGSTFSHGMQYAQNPADVIKASADAFKNWNRNRTESFRKGINRVNHNALEMSFGVDALDGFNRLRDVMSDVQGRSILEQTARTTAYGQGKWMAHEYVDRFLRGSTNKQVKQFIDLFGKGMDIKKMTPENYNEMAARFVEAVQGSYDYRGLPVVAVDHTWAPIFAISRWGIEKTNNFAKHVIKPAMNGNPMPLFMATLGNIVGGVAITEMTRALTGRKERVPEVGEIVEADIPVEEKMLPLLYRGIAYAQMSGYMGIASDLMKSALDVTYGKNYPQEVNNILYSSIVDTVDTVADFVSAVKEGEEVTPELAMEFINELLIRKIQNYRYLETFLSEDKKLRIAKSNKIRDLHVFKLLEGMPLANPIKDFNKFENSEVRKFRDEQDPAKAQEQLQGLLARALEKAEGNPEVLRSELMKLKRHNYQTMPNPETMPISFQRYLGQLTRTQGPEKAAARLEDYIKRNSFNRQKSRAVPTL